MLDNPAILGLVTIAIGVGGCVGYFYGANVFLDKVLFPVKNFTSEQGHSRRMRISLIAAVIPFALLFVLFVFPALTSGASGMVSSDIVQEGLGFSIGFQRLLVAALASVPVFLVFWFLLAGEQTAGRNINRANMIRPWIFLFPAIFALGLYLAYPVVATLIMSLQERLPGGQTQFVGFDNYRQMMNEDKFWEAMRNNAMWLIIVPALSTAFGLLAAQLTDRISWGSIAKSIIFMPMAISFVGAAVIFKLIYDSRPIDAEQIGILNAIYLTLGGTEPQEWLTIPFWNNFFLMIVLIWIQTGFAMVILSAALRGIPEETVEAAVIDGANPLQVFFKIKIPQITSTIVVVWTTITIATLKVFDIVFAMTNGQWETQVLANYMYNQLFVTRDWGVGSASAMIIMLLVTPILVWNIHNARKEMR